MACPQPFFLTGSPIVLRLLLAMLRKLSTQGSVMMSRMRTVMGTATGLALTYAAYRTYQQGDSLVKQAECRRKKTKKMMIDADGHLVEFQPRDGLKPRPDDAYYLNLAGATVRPQPSVAANDRAHALFLWIKVKDGANARDVASSVACLQAYCQEVAAPAESVCGDINIIAGVGFGPEFYKQINGAPPQPFSNDKHNLITSSTVGGDILLHAKCNSEEMLQKLSKKILSNLPPNSVQNYEETYTQTRYQEELQNIATQVNSENDPTIINFQYTQGDLELFPPNKPLPQNKPRVMIVSDAGTDNAPPRRQEVAVDSGTGGSYVMTQRWVHDAKLVETKGELIMNQWVDKAWEECAGPPGEKKFKTESMLEAEMANVSMDQWMADAYEQCVAMQQKYPDSRIVCTSGILPSKFHILRQSLPYKNKAGDNGLFFVSYASTPKYNEMLLDQLISSALGGSKVSSTMTQNVFLLSSNVRSASWYFPGQQELEDLE